METRVSNDSIDVSVKDGEKCFMSCNTTEYNGDGNCGITIGGMETMKKIGWVDDEENLNLLEVGERYDSEDYGDTAFIIRLG
jgi:hypothetical protein